jgi:hypothetical protein
MKERKTENREKQIENNKILIDNKFYSIKYFISIK